MDRRGQFEDIANMLAYSRRAESASDRDLSEAVCEAMLEYALTRYPDAFAKALALPGRLGSPIRQQVVGPDTRLDISASILDGNGVSGELVLELKTGSAPAQDQIARQAEYLLSSHPAGHSRLVVICREKALVSTRQLVGSQLSAAELHPSRSGEDFLISESQAVVRVSVLPWSFVSALAPQHLFGVIAAFAERSAYPFLPLARVNLANANVGTQLASDLGRMRAEYHAIHGRTDQLRLMLMGDLLIGVGVGSKQGFGVEFDPFSRSSNTPMWLAHYANSRSKYAPIDPNSSPPRAGQNAQTSVTASASGVIRPRANYPWIELQVTWTILRDLFFVVNDRFDLHCSSTASGDVFALSFSDKAKIAGKNAVVVLNVDRWSRGDLPIHIDPCGQSCPGCQKILGPAPYRDALVGELLSRL